MTVEFEKIDENIYYYKSLMKDSESVMSIIEDSEYDDELKKIISEWKLWPQPDYHRGLQKTFSHEKSLEDQFKDLNVSKEAQDKIMHVINSMSDTFDKAIEHYKNEKNIKERVHRYHDYRISLYRPGGFLDVHYDHPETERPQRQESGNPNIKYTVLLYMGRECRGGEISWVKFKDDNDNRRQYAAYPVSHEKNKDIIDFFIKPESGSIVIFPSGYPYMHAAHIVLSGTKYLISEFWRKGPQDKPIDWE